MQTHALDANTTLFTAAHYHCEVTQQWFQPSYWLEQNKVYAQKTGRAVAYFFSHDGLNAVLRHYWRGGLVGKLLSDQYLYTGLEQTRVYKEFKLMCALYEQGLPVVEPIAALVQKSGFIYRGDIITRALEGAQSLCEVLTRGELEGAQLENIGKTIAQFHNAGVYHADLNINNILFDANQRVHVIDFDRGEIRAIDHAWQQENMARLERSFAKEAGRQSQFYWQAEHWQQLLDAYQQALN